MRHISFALTTQQFLDGTKTVTRRLGWKNLKPGDVLCAVEKGQGLKRGEKVKKLGMLRVVDVYREPLRVMTRYDGDGDSEVIAEGFPDYFPEAFIAMFCKHNRCTPDTEVTRIQFEKL